MSRYSVGCPTFVRAEAVVGWDAARHTFFFATFDLDEVRGPSEPDAPSSAGPDDLGSVWSLLAACAGIADISDDTVGLLLDDPGREARGNPARVMAQNEGS